MSHPIDQIKEELAGNDGSVEGYGLVAALEEMTPHWESHIADGQHPSILVTDLKRLEEKVRELRQIIQEFQGTGSEAPMKVSLDGGRTFEPVTGDVRVLYSNVMVDGEDEEGQMDVVLTREGIIADLWVSREGSFDHNLGTSSQTLDELQGEMVSENQ